MMRDLREIKDVMGVESAVEGGMGIEDAWRRKCVVQASSDSAFHLPFPCGAVPSYCGEFHGNNGELLVRLPTVLP